MTVIFDGSGSITAMRADDGEGNFNAAHDVILSSTPATGNSLNTCAGTPVADGGGCVCQACPSGTRRHH